MSNFIVSARKYRPNRFVDVVGQEHVTQTLKNALQNDHLAHAFLFCGPRGVGKTTCARILAKVLNCQSVTDEFEPCNSCTSCQSFNENASFNITELDAASNNSVEHIRALIEQVRFQPQQGKYKIFIIDEVHMLSQQAFNAFLKTLEEPPAYAIFILATTEKHKIIPTILSRCQIFDFRRIQVPRVVAHLEEICTAEGIQAEADALHIIGQKADGALRDALSIFDRIVSFSGNNIRYEDVISNLNVLDYDYYFKLVDAFLAEDLAGIMNLFDTILRNGFEPDIFMIGLAEHLRNLLVCQNPKTLALLEISESLRARYQTQAQLSPTSLLLTALNLANDCDVHYKMARNKRLHVEMTLIKMTYINRAVELAQRPVQAAPIPEKKTLVESAPPAPASVQEPAPVLAKPPKPTPPAPTLKAAVVKATPPPVPVAEMPKAPKKTGLRRSPKYSMPSLKDLDTNLTKEVVAEKKQEAKISAERPPLQLGEVQEQWRLYTQSVPASVAAILKNVELELQNDTLVAKVGSNLGENIIRQEHKMFDQIRTNLQRPGLALEVKVDASKAQPKERPKVNKLLTPREKVAQMIAINPLVRDFVERLDLTPDE